jgi:hypothetical protein
MKPTPKQIDEIAQMLDSGEHCFYHRSTGEIESYPDPDNPSSEPDDWQEIIDKIEENEDDYIHFKPLRSNEAFVIMQHFALDIEDRRLQNRLLDALEQNKPFRNFMHRINNSDYREDWFKYKKAAYIKFVEKEIEDDQEVN